MTSFSWGAATETGQVRQGNEDFVLAVDGLFAVADGMGGHRGGEVASHLAIETLEGEVSGDGAMTIDQFVEAVERANATLVAKATDDPTLKGMGTTLCALARVVFDDEAAIGIVNVGDSRLYVLKEGELEQITEDHSLVATLERQGRLTRAEAAVHPQRNIVTRALGIDTRVMVDSWVMQPVVGDRYLICSDGLFNEVEDPRIAATLRKLADPGEAAHELVRLANEGGGRDNISVVVVDVVDDGGSGAVAGDSRVISTVHGRDRVDGSPDGARIAHIDTEGDGDGEHLATRAAPVAPTAPPVPPSVSVPGGAPPEPAAQPRRRRLTWRVGLFVVLFLAVVGAAIGAIVYSGTQTYYVGIEGDHVAIYQGRPGGVLWIDPTVEESYPELTVNQMPAETRPDLEKGKQEGSLAEARNYVANLHEQLLSQRSNPSTFGGPSTTSTTAPEPLGEEPPSFVTIPN